MKKKQIAIIFIFISFAMLLLGCSNNEFEEYGNVEVTFCLEGGTYKSSKHPIIYRYDLKDNTMKIKNPVDLMNSTYKIEKSGYELTGWYRNKEEKDGIVTYTGKWDFDTDVIKETDVKNGITLYANWQVKKVYSYAIYYIDENGQEQFLINQEVNEGGRLLESAAEDALNGYTFIKYLNEDGTVWDTNFKHPGGDGETSIKVIAQYEKGNYKVVRTKLELTNAIKNAKNNIYLDADIDMEGAKVYFKNYRGTLKGNNHKIYNFSLNQTYNGTLKDTLENNVLYVSLFGDLENAIVENVSFENVTLELDAGLSTIKEIYLLPLARKMTNSKISNVSFSGTYQVKKYPESETFNENENFIVVKTEYLEKDDASIVSSNKIEFKELENTEKEN